jgi:diadenosine tetraphosphate (Ap4A) HIT family hydrolase
MFELDPKLASDTWTLGAFDLSLLLMSRDANYPWFILVPQRPRMREIYQLALADRGQLLEESCRLSEALMDVFSGDKLNIAALGNQVAQLHVHHIVRYEGDVAWPGPVWGAAPPGDYTEELRTERVGDLLSVLRGEGFRETG